MSKFLEFSALYFNDAKKKWVWEEDMEFYLLWPEGPVLTVPAGFEADFSAPGIVAKLGIFDPEGIREGKAGGLHDLAFNNGARPIVASAVLYEALRAQEFGILKSLGAFIGSWFVSTFSDEYRLRQKNSH